jgi:hypothetical protein
MPSTQTNKCTYHSIFIVNTHLKSIEAKIILKSLPDLTFTNAPFKLQFSILILGHYITSHNPGQSNC